MERQSRPITSRGQRPINPLWKQVAWRGYSVYDIKQVGESDRGNDEVADIVASKLEQTLLEVTSIMRYVYPPMGTHFHKSYLW